MRRIISKNLQIAVSSYVSPINLVKWSFHYYKFLLKFFFKIIEIVGDEKLCSHEELGRYFHQVVYPLGINKYQVKHSHATTEDGELIITTLVMDAINSEDFTRGSVRTNWVVFP